MRRLTLGTAGHIDHGKTSLVQALTGVDTDRLPEEKRRGITIDIGFASLQLGDIELGIVDVPGHEAFIRNMLAGATGIDLVLLVVAADEGVMPQTREHLAIVRLLGVRRGVVAITKVETVDPDWLELVTDDVQALLAGTHLAKAPILAVSARTGEGLPALRTALAHAAAQAEDRNVNDVARLPVDRVFTVHGTGTVVTGTVWSGRFDRDSRIIIHPRGEVARVRGLQRHGAEVDEIRAGERGAIALAGIDRHELGRGDTLIAGAMWPAASVLTVRMHVLADAGGPVVTRQRVHVHLATGEVIGRVAVADGAIEPGGDGLAQLRLEKPLVARAGDRVVIRAWSPARTIGGAVVLEPVAMRRKRWSADARRLLADLARPDTALDSLLELAGPAGLAFADLPRLLPPGAAVEGSERTMSEDTARVGDRLVLDRYLAEASRRLTAAVTAFHARAPIEPGMEREALRRAVDADTGAALFDVVLATALADGSVVSRNGCIALPAHEPRPAGDQQPLLQRLREIYTEAALQAPTDDELPADLANHPQLGALLAHLEREGTLVRLAPGRWSHASAVSDAASAIRSQMASGKALGIADFRQVLDLSRKHLLPLLEHFDRTGVTVRSGDTRLLA